MSMPLSPNSASLKASRRASTAGPCSPGTMSAF
jgi:hypothetical protein